MARLDKNFDPDFVLKRLCDLLRKETSIASDSSSDIEAEARALRDNPTKARRVVYLGVLICQHAGYQKEQYSVRISQIRLARNKGRDTYLRGDLQFSMDIAEVCQDLLAAIPSDEPGLSRLRQLVERALAEELSSQEECKGRIQKCEERRSTIRGSSTKPRRGERTPLATLTAKLRDDTLRLLNAAGYKPDEIAATIYRKPLDKQLDQPSKRVGKYISRVRPPEKRLNKSRAVQ